MEDKPTGEGDKQTGEKQAPQSPPPALTGEKEARKKGANPEERRAESAQQTPPQAKWKRFVGWVYPMEFSDFVMISLTAAIAFGTIVSAIAIAFQWHEMHVGGADTTRIANAADKIKASAGQSAQASSDFAITAEGINTKIGLAEQDFSKMAKNSSDSIRATQDQMRQDQRAWVGVAQIVPNEKFDGDTPWGASVVFVNSGKSAARNVQISVRYRTSPYPLLGPLPSDINKLTFRAVQSIAPEGRYILKIASQAAAEPHTVDQVMGNRELIPNTPRSTTKACSFIILGFLNIEMYSGINERRSSVYIWPIQRRERLGSATPLMI
ncbi:MAG TPA: hypothetical protein VMD58_00765 [Acidobacteriaceae bacterium]|nr:hypothetical protein [Acidobacteriaceae bacterium]